MNISNKDFVWSASIAYKKEDIVSSADKNGSTVRYIALHDINVDHITNICPLLDTINWVSLLLYGQKGDKGDKGDRGERGRISRRFIQEYQMNFDFETLFLKQHDISLKYSTLTRTVNSNNKSTISCQLYDTKNNKITRNTGITVTMMVSGNSAIINTIYTSQNTYVATFSLSPTNVNSIRCYLNDRLMDQVLVLYQIVQSYGVTNPTLRTNKNSRISNFNRDDEVLLDRPSDVIANLDEDGITVIVSFNHMTTKYLSFIGRAICEDGTIEEELIVNKSPMIFSSLLLGKTYNFEVKSLNQNEEESLPTRSDCSITINDFVS